jgi:hypothetical protein
MNLTIFNLNYIFIIFNYDYDFNFEIYFYLLKNLFFLNFHLISDLFHL